MSVDVDPVFGCELWTGRTTRSGYGRNGLHGAHRVAWEAAYGPIPEGFVADHLCAQRRCVALHHIEIVTQSENLFRRSWAYRLRIKQCPKGHDMSINGVLVPPNGRVCRTCNREAAARG